MKLECVRTDRCRDEYQAGGSGGGGVEEGIREGVERRSLFCYSESSALTHQRSPDKHMDTFLYSHNK